MVMKMKDKKTIDIPVDKIMEKVPSNEKMDKHGHKIIFIIFVIVIFCAILFSVVMANSLSPYSRTDTSRVEFKVESGWGSSTVVQKLEEQKLIKNAFFVKLYLKLNPQNNIKEGTYTLSPSMDVMEIFNVLSSNDSKENETINLKLIEGKRFDTYAENIATTFGFNKDDVINKAKDKDFLNKEIKKYWFVTDDILNQDLYYPLEGYVFPDTYNMRKNVTIEEVLDTLIAETGKKIEPYKEDINNSGKSVHALLSLASVIELEAGTGSVDIDGKTASEREAVSSVFYNRIKNNTPLGSDVTTYYDVKKTLQEPLTMNDISACHKYNTREVAKCVNVPVGPICSPSLSSIVAALKPADTNLYYFVADKNGKLYFAKDLAGHNKNIEYLKSHDLWG